jgi:hypothetical protein
LESLFDGTDLDYAMLDLRSLFDYRSPQNDAIYPENGAWIRGEVVCKPYGEERQIGDWPNVFDGLIFIREMEPSTTAN